MKKEWIIWGVIALLAIALVVGVIILTNANKVPPEQDDTGTTQNTTSGETTLPTEGTTVPEETTQPSDPEDTTGPEETTTSPEETTQPEDTTGASGDSTTPTTKPNTDEGNGFGERDPVTSTTQPEQETTKPPVNETTPPTMTPEETDPTTKEEMTYQSYRKLSTDEQIAFRETFPNDDAFMAWFKAAQKAYEDSQQKVVVGNGNSIDLGELIGTEPNP